MAAQLGYWLTHTVVFAWMDSWSKCQYCCMLLWSSVTIIKFENHYCYHTQNKSKNNNKFSKNDKKVRTDNFFNQWLWVTQWLSDLQRYCKQTGLALQPAAWHHFKVIPDSSRTIWPALWVGWPKKPKVQLFPAPWPFSHSVWCKDCKNAKKKWKKLTFCPSSRAFFVYSIAAYYASQPTLSNAKKHQSNVAQSTCNPPRTVVNLRKYDPRSLDQQQLVNWVGNNWIFHTSENRLVL